jgi:quercetin dioxygenase-like cupin family protein
MTWRTDEAGLIPPMDKLSLDPGWAEKGLASDATITRRRLLWLSALTGAAIFGRSPQIAARGMTKIYPDKTIADTNQNAIDLGWDDFLKQCVPVAEELHHDSSKSGQDAYLYWVASMVSRLRLKEAPRAKLGRYGTLDPPVHFGRSFRGKPFFIVEWWLEPGAVLPPHCHPNASVCTLGIEGEARIRNFEIVGDTPDFSSKRTFQVRETHNEIIAPGRLNTLSALRDNIHTFQAGKQGARGIDISTYHGPDVGFSFLDISDKARVAEQRIYEAAWKKL